MTRQANSPSNLKSNFICLLLTYTLLVSLCAPLASVRAMAAPGGGTTAKAAAIPARPVGQPGPARAGELLVRFRASATEQEKGEAAAARGAARRGRLRGASSFERLELALDRDPLATAAALSAHPAVEFVEPNYLIKGTDVTPDDPRFAEQWALGGGAQPSAGVAAPAAWARTTGSPDTVIAVIDSGIDFSHPDLANNRWLNAREREDGRDNDDDGFADDLHGWDWVSASHHAGDPSGHGTAIAGIIAAEGNNAAGTAGVMWRASLMSLRVLDNAGTGDVADAVEAIDYAAAHGAQVINLSWGLDAPSVALLDAIGRAAASGVIVVCSAGNGGQNVDGQPYYPAAYDVPNLIAVAATDSSDNLTSWSNWGASHVAVGAPGVDILTTKVGGDYQTVSGTSAAAPLVSGIAGLVKTLYPRLGAAAARAAILNGARRAPGLEGKVSSAGVANAAGALDSAGGGSQTSPGGGGGNNGGGSGGDNGNGGGNGNGNGNGQGVTPIPAAPGRGGGGNGPDGGFNTAPPEPTKDAPPNFMNQDVARRSKPAEPKAPTFIRANLMPVCDIDCGDSVPPGGVRPDPDLSAPRTLPQNETGQPGVDLGSRNFNWSLPLVSLPGRAGLDLSVVLYYNSLLWATDGSVVRYNSDRGAPGPGFRIGMPTVQQRYYDGQFGAYAYMLIMPSGGRVRLQQLGTSNTYESADGSFTQLVANGDGTLLVRVKGGMQLSFAPSVNGEFRCTQIKDRNGNYITATYNALGRIATITDTLARVVTFNYDASNYLTSITQTRGGAQYVWATFGYGEVAVQPNFPGLYIEGPNYSSIPVLTRVGLPDGSYYAFGYENPWGIVNRIVRYAPGGGQLAYSFYNIPATSTAHTDSPRFTERREWAKDWNNGAEAVTTYSAAADNSWTQVTAPDGTSYKEFFAITGWQKGLTTSTEVWSGGVKKKWTNTTWTQDVTGPVSLPVGDSGFENPVVGYGVHANAPAGGAWAFTADASGAAGLSGTNSALTNGMSAPPDGAQVAFLYGRSGGSISQSVAGFAGGVTYALNFSAAQRRYSNTGGQDFDVYLDNMLLGTYRPSSYFYTPYTIRFSTTPGTHTVKFVGRGTSGAALTVLLDKVSITAAGDAQANPRVAESNVYDDAGNRRRVTTDYGPYAAYGLPHVVTEYGADGVTVLRRTQTDYVTDANYINRRLVGLVSAVHLYEGNGALSSKTTYSYDWPTWNGDMFQDTPAPATQHDRTNYGPSFITGRGNLSQIARYDVNDPNNTQNTWQETKLRYNSTGSVLMERDHGWHPVYYDYADSFSDGVNRNTFAYPTKNTDGDNFSSLAQYSYDTGATTRAQDPRGAALTTTYDAAGRVLRVTNQVNNAYTRYEYDLDYGHTRTYTSVNALQDDAYSNTIEDGAGRAWLQVFSHAGSAGGYRAVQVQYNNMGRAAKTSNMTEITAGGTPTGDDAAGYQWTLQQYDWQGRPTLMTYPTGNTVEASYVGCGCAGGEVTTVRDERSRRRKLHKDAFGRLVKVNELNWDQSVYSTSTYSYNARDQITRIDQQGQARTFEYDGRGRLSARTTPEQGRTSYAYNSDDTMRSITDARGAVTNLVYNARHLITNVNYTVPSGVAATPNVTFGYDAAGNRTSMTDGLGTATYHYDALSRMDWEERTFSGSGPYRLSYGYNLTGELKSVTNPWGAQVSYAHDASGRVASVGGANFGGVSTYAQGLTYRAFDGLKGMAYGNSKSFSALYDARMRMTKWDVSGVLGFNYSYSTFGENTRRVTYAQNLYDATLDRSYDYDHVGRLLYSYTGINARAHAGTPGGRWDVSDGPYAQDYQYDVWGNLTRRGGWGGANPSYTAGFTNNRRAGGQYDAAGNITNDGGQSFQYDATGQQTYASATGLQQGYDGDGMRVKKTENGVTTYYLRSSVLGGNVAAEISGGGVWQRGYVYLGSQLLALQDNGAVLWAHQDPVVKSQRLTNAAGGVTAGVELDPWGGETNRSWNDAQQPQRFTSYTRDASGSDEAGMRRYNRWWSRFDQPDPFDGSYNLTDPQSLNRYAYTQNDPVNFTDPSGLMMCSAQFSFSECGGWEGMMGGYFGDDYAYWQRDFGGMSPEAAAGLATHIERVNNVQAGYGFLTNAEVTAALEESFKIYYTLYSDGTLETKFNLSVTVTASLAWHQRGILGPIGDFSRGVANTVTFGITERVHESRGEPRPDTAYSTAGEWAGVGFLVAIPAAGAVRAIGSTLRVTFGHGARHLAGTGLSRRAVESAIRSQVRSAASQSSSTGQFWGRVTVRGTNIEYRAFTMPNGTVNVGTYYPIP